MERIHRDGFLVSGISVRTTNKNEMSPQGGKIPGLWQNFSTFLHRSGQQPSLVYGVYSGYNTDQNGEFDVTAAIVGDFPDVEKRDLSIPAGSYLRFSKNGPCPETVVELWREIWSFFEENGAPERAYLFDFEEYVGAESVNIFIGIKEGL